MIKLRFKFDLLLLFIEKDFVDLLLLLFTFFVCGSFLAFIILELLLKLLLIIVLFVLLYIVVGFVFNISFVIF